MQNKIIIIGASNKTKLVFDFLINENKISRVFGLIDNDINKKDQIILDKKVLGNYEYLINMNLHDNYSVCISMSENYFYERKIILNDLEQRNFKIDNIISKKAYVSKLSKIGKNVIIFPNCAISGYTKLEDNITLWSGATIDHDCIIHSNVDISPRVAIAGKVEIQSNTFIGINSTILPGIKIGENVIVGAGSVVTKSIPNSIIVAGNPAKIIGENCK